MIIVWRFFLNIPPQSQKWIITWTCWKEGDWSLFFVLEVALVACKCDWIVQESQCAKRVGTFFAFGKWVQNLSVKLDNLALVELFRYFKHIFLEIELFLLHFVRARLIVIKLLKFTLSPLNYFCSFLHIVGIVIFSHALLSIFWFRVIFLTSTFRGDFQKQETGDLKLFWRVFRFRRCSHVRRCQVDCKSI